MKPTFLPVTCLKTGGRRFLLQLLLVLAVLTAVQARPVQDIAGKVTDEEGEPVPGVTILVKGTTVGTTTNTRAGLTKMPIRMACLTTGKRSIS
jgi:hypothetical protein